MKNDEVQIFPRLRRTSMRAPGRGDGCLPAPAEQLTRARGNTSALMGGAIFFRACGTGKGQEKKKGLQQKTEKLLRSILLIRAFLERAPESDRLALALARRKRLAEIGTKRENRTRQKHGVEQSTAPSRAAAARDDGSSGVRAFELKIVSSARYPKIC